MKKALTVTAFIAASLATSMGTLASDGKITINGLVTDSSCSIAVNGGSGEATVTLPTVSTSSLAAAGDVAGATPIVMQLTGCPSSGSVRAFFETDNVDVGTGYLVNNAVAGADNVEVQIVNGMDGSEINLGDNTGNDYVDFVSTGGESGAEGSATLNYAAQYVALDAATAGKVETALVYTLDYQ
ncbi:fimbrial protein [Halomonas cupida]|uniref:fimbrial protein n=1 Tax=Halomonas cupida TaxID=44933 RepID=UPI003A935D65